MDIGSREGEEGNDGDGLQLGQRSDGKLEDVSGGNRVIPMSMIAREAREMSWISMWARLDGQGTGNLTAETIQVT